MAILLSTVIDKARSRHAAFHRTRVPARVVGDFLGDYQNELIQKACLRDRAFCAQRVSIVIALGTTAPEAVGAGTGDGLPGREIDGGYEAVVAPAGNVISAATTEAGGATVRVPPIVATAVGASTISKTAAGWTVNEHVGRICEITNGPGFGTRRSVLSNTATQLTFADAWTVKGGTLPVANVSLFQVVEPVYTGAEDMSVITDLPARVTSRGYLVKLDATGTPTIDLTAPLVASLSVGVALPPRHALLRGAVYFTDGDEDPLTIVSVGQRLDPPRTPAVYEEGGSLYLCGDSDEWEDVASLELVYIPIAPDFTGLSQFFLVPDAAQGCLVAKAADLMAGRVAGMEGVDIDTKGFVARAIDAEATYLSSLRLARSGRRGGFRMDR